MRPGIFELKVAATCPPTTLKTQRTYSESPQLGRWANADVRGRPLAAALLLELRDDGGGGAHDLGAVADREWLRRVSR